MALHYIAELPTAVSLHFTNLPTTNGIALHRRTAHSRLFAFHRLPNYFAELPTVVSLHFTIQLQYEVCKESVHIILQDLHIEAGNIGYIHPIIHFSRELSMSQSTLLSSISHHKKGVPKAIAHQLVHTWAIMRTGTCMTRAISVLNWAV
jgi:hypothetical protein